MNIRLVCAVAFAASSATACEGLEGSQYADIDDDPQMAAIGASIPQSSIPPPPVLRTPNAPAIPAPPAQTTGGPSQMPKPPTAPPVGATGGPSQAPKPPQATPPKVTPAPAPRPVGCSSPNVSIRTEANGAVEIKCAAPPMAPPASLKCASPEVLTWLTRNGTSSYVCMK